VQLAMCLLAECSSCASSAVECEFVIIMYYNDHTNAMQDLKELGFNMNQRKKMTKLIDSLAAGTHCLE
jgi:hypothetical protein